MIWTLCGCFVTWWRSDLNVWLVLSVGSAFPALLRGDSGHSCIPVCVISEQLLRKSVCLVGVLVFAEFGEMLACTMPKTVLPKRMLGVVFSSNVQAWFRIKSGNQEKYVLSMF